MKFAKSKKTTHCQKGCVSHHSKTVANTAMEYIFQACIPDLKYNRRYFHFSSLSTGENRWISDRSSIQISLLIRVSISIGNQPNVSIWGEPNVFAQRPIFEVFCCEMVASLLRTAPENSGEFFSLFVPIVLFVR